ncbi:MAG: Imm70 family immunity protein [Methylophilaceae bacterium]
MAVGITIGSITDEIGETSFLYAFFSTVSGHCEPKGWGTRFPHLMKELYQGSLPYKNAGSALEELTIAKTHLCTLPPSSVAWDIENKQAQPPWGANIATTITNLGNYFVSSTGRDLFALLQEALEASIEERKDALLTSY